MKVKNRKPVMAVISFVLCLFAIPAAAISMTYFRDVFQGKSTLTAMDTARTFIMLYSPFFWYYLSEVYGKGDFKMNSTTDKIFECQEVGTQTKRFIFADTEAEVLLYLSLSDERVREYTITETDMSVEGFEISIPATSKIYKQRKIK